MLVLLANVSCSSTDMCVYMSRPLFCLLHSLDDRKHMSMIEVIMSNKRKVAKEVKVRVLSFFSLIPTLILAKVINRAQLVGVLSFTFLSSCFLQHSHNLIRQCHLLMFCLIIPLVGNVF